MKILFCAYDRPSHMATGPNAWLQRLIPDLRTRYGLDIVTLFVHAGEAADCPTLSFFRTKQLPVITINSERLPYVADQVKAILNIVKTHQITVVVANLVIPAYYAARYLKPFHIPVVGVLHSNDWFYKSVIQKFVKGTIANQLTAVVSVSKYIQALAISEDVTTDYKVIPCGTPLLNKQAFWSGNEPLKIIYAGRLVIEAKQIVKLTQAFCDVSKCNPNLAFSIYGDGAEEANVKRVILDAQSSASVTLFKALPPSKIISKIAEHHVFTLMSDYEGMPVALMEAMACGVVPVCYVGVGGINEIITHGVNGFIVKNRTTDYQEKLELLYTNRALWQTMSQNAIVTIKERYSSAITHQQWVDLLQGFDGLATKKIKVPSRITLKGELLYYGDNRKPGFSVKLKNAMVNNWLLFKLFVRPRARLRTLLKK